MASAFGAAAVACPCGGVPAGAPLSACCAPLLAGAPAATAEALMRSRYTAFALGDAAHLRSTWHPSTAPDDLTLDDGLRWERLTIEQTSEGMPGHSRGTVAFRARWCDTRTGERGELVEHSRFVFHRTRWWYVDGDL